MGWPGRQIGRKMELSGIYGISDVEEGNTNDPRKYLPIPTFLPESAPGRQRDDKEATGHSAFSRTLL